MLWDAFLVRILDAMDKTGMEWTEEQRRAGGQYLTRATACVMKMASDEKNLGGSLWELHVAKREFLDIERPKTNYMWLRIDEDETMRASLKMTPAQIGLRVLVYDGGDVRNFVEMGVPANAEDLFDRAELERVVRDVRTNLITAGRGVCARCGKRGTDLKKCRRCRVVRYCSKECQIADWNILHKHMCKSLAERSPV